MPLSEHLHQPRSRSAGRTADHTDWIVSCTSNAREIDAPLYLNRKMDANGAFANQHSCDSAAGEKWDYQ